MVSWRWSSCPLWRSFACLSEILFVIQNFHFSNRFFDLQLLNVLFWQRKCLSRLTVQKTWIIKFIEKRSIPNLFFLKNIVQISCVCLIMWFLLTFEIPRIIDVSRGTQLLFLSFPEYQNTFSWIFTQYFFEKLFVGTKVIFWSEIGCFYELIFWHF